MDLHSIRLLAALLCASMLPAATPPREVFRGGVVEWTRLNTGSRYWDRHSASDRNLLTMMRTHTSLNIAPTWKFTKPESLEDLCRYPFVYSDNVAPLSPQGAQNVAEYLRRGGFLLIDACVNDKINPDFKVFTADQSRRLREVIPELRVQELPPEHEIFTIYFNMNKRPPHLRKGDCPLRAFYIGDRMVGILSISSFQCGWAFVGRQNRDQTAVDCVQMVTNIYVYAMTR